MIPLSRRAFDVYALSLPYGLDFGDSPAIAGFQSKDGFSFGAILCNEIDGRFGYICMRRRTDYVWTVIEQDGGFRNFRRARVGLARAMRNGRALEPIPSGARPRPELYELGTKGASPMFDFVRSEACLSGAWALQQVYLAMPSPDHNWVSDCQTSNFHTRLWEAYLFACFREQGCLVTQNVPSPDFHVSDRAGNAAWIEAVTANAEPFDHSNATPVAMPNHLERQIGSAAVRFARTLRSKLQRGYDTMAHVQDMPFAIAIADYHAPGSMVWSHDALPAYLYGLHAVFEERDGQQVGVMKTHSTLLGDDAIPSGLFKDPANSGLAAVIFSNAGTISKFNRMGLLAGIGKDDITVRRMGLLFDRTMPEDKQTTLFDYDITGDEYAALWPDTGETWSVELNVFHNPLAKHPLPFDLLPDCTHWFEHNGEVLCRYFYERTVLSSNTVATYGDVT